MITVDGSTGSGQMLRTALALSSITLNPFEITEIRKNRPNPGLKPQHLSCIKALGELCNASFEGAELNSTAIKFFPGKTQSKTLNIDIGTAGSVTLLMQSILLPSLFAPNKVIIKLKGGTNVKFSQPVEYFNSVFLPQIPSLAKVSYSILKRGYFPKGNGLIDIEITPFFHLRAYDTFNDLNKETKQKLKPFNLTERGSLSKISGVSHASSDLRDKEIAERQAQAAKVSLSKKLEELEMNCPMSIQTEYSETPSTGSGISLFAHFNESGKDEPSPSTPIILGADALGEQGKLSESIGQEAAESLIKEITSGACVDQYLADQLIPFMAITGGKIKTSQITKHCLENISVVEKFLGKSFEIDQENNIITSN
jgi:RNA 3'-terminal phosphate cyclase (GTP)